ncbi:hypothetical protein ACHWQZ_G010887 [Mnemiopsis leidyi]
MSTPPEASRMNVDDTDRKTEQETTTLPPKEPEISSIKTQLETTTLNEIKSIFQKPPHEVDICQAQNTAKKIMESSQDEQMRRIGDALGSLYRLDPDNDGYSISPFILGNFKKYKLGKAWLPKPPQNWREMLNIQSAPRGKAPLRKFNPFRSPTTSTPSSTESTADSPKAMAEKLKSLRSQYSDVTGQYAEKYTDLMGELTSAKELVLRLENDVKKLTSQYEKESRLLEQQIKETHNKMVLPTTQASSSRTTAAPYRNKKPAPSDTYGRNRRAGTWTTTPQGDGRRATERFYTGILTGPQSRSLAKGPAIRNATLNLAMAEVAEQQQKLMPCISRTPQEGKTFNIWTSTEWNPQVLDNKEPTEYPKFMGKLWGQESSSYDLSKLNLGISSDALKTSIFSLVKAKLNRNVDTVEQFMANITDLALHIELMSIQFTCKLLDSSDSVFKNLSSDISEDTRSHFLVTTIKLRTSEFLRHMALYLSNCQSLYGGDRAPCQFAKAIGGDLCLVLNKLWWLANISIPVPSTIRYV